MSRVDRIAQRKRTKESWITTGKYRKNRPYFKEYWSYVKDIIKGKR